MLKLKVITVSLITCLLAFAVLLNSSFFDNQFDVDSNKSVKQLTKESNSQDRENREDSKGIGKQEQPEDVTGNPEKPKQDAIKKETSIQEPMGEPEPQKPALKVTVSDIEKRYRPKFLALKQEYDAKINNLAARGMNEYRTYKQNGENPPVIQLAKTYLGAGNALEDECDSRFNALLAQMKQDLLKANLPLNIVERAKSEYRSQKINRKKQLIKNGLKFMGE